MKEQKEEKKETILPDMITFKGKLTCSPNTLNNQYHTYRLAYFWQQKNNDEIFQKLIESQNNQKRENTVYSMEWRRQDPESTLEYSQKKWMELINSVADFNRAYVECFNKIFPQKPKLNIMDFKAFRLFHDWDVWGDSTCFPELKATSVSDCKNTKFQNLKDKNVYLSSKMGGNKCIIANLDTDSQDMSKLFSFTLNMNEQLKLNTSPSVCRVLHFRTIDTLPWTSSMGVDWFSSGRVSLLHTGIKKQDIKYPFNTIYKETQNSHCLFRMMQYRYNHPTKVSNVVGYIMNTDSNNPCPNKYWRIIQAKGEYKNPNPAKIYNSNLNNKTTIEVYIQNIYKEQEKNGILIDLSGAILDGNDKDNFPNYPETFEVTIYQMNRQPINIIYENKERVLKFFHQQAAIHIVPDRRIVGNSPIKIQINMNIRSQLIQQAIKVELSGTENEYQIEMKDKFVKTRIHDDYKNIHNNYIEQTLLITRYGQPVNGSLRISLKSKFNIDSSGLTQYTRNQDYLKFINDQIQTKVTQMDPHASFDDYKLILPKDRLDLILNQTKTQASIFKEKFGDTLQKIDNNVFQGKLKWISQMTDDIVKRLFIQGTGLSYSFLQGDKKMPFQLCFRKEQTNLLQDTIKFNNGQATIKLYLNEDLTKQNNPRSPQMQSLCILGQFIIEIPDKKPIQSTDFTGIFYENSFVFDKQNKGHGFVDPYEKIDWLNVVGPKLRVMGLMYPSMQKIVDLYNYDGLSMDAMKRAFEIQDENHSRYMPATRQMSPITHRQIRRWLYNPVYDANVKIKPIPIRNRFLSFLFHSHKDDSNKSDTSERKKSFQQIQIQDIFKKIQTLQELRKKKEQLTNDIQKKKNQLKGRFMKKKDQLIQFVKAAFKLQLTTIPIYLSALYSLQKEGQTAKLIRSIAKDEMRHLFIVSNLMNSLSKDVSPPYPIPKQKTPKDIPSYPIEIQDLMVFHFKDESNQQWRLLMSQISIKPCNQRQLLKFIVIEVPSEIYDVKYQFNNENTNATNKPPKLSLIGFLEQIENKKLRLLTTSKQYERLQTLKQRVQNLDKLITAVGLQLTRNQGQVEDRNKFLTIGMAYQKIMKLLWQLDDLQKLCHKNQVKVKLFSGDIRKQYTYIYLQNMTKIYDLRTALEQIRLITEQGEGSNLFNLKGQLNKTSHFIKFLEIYTGCDISIHSQYTKEDNNADSYERTAVFNLKPNEKKFPDFGNETKIEWTKDNNEQVWETVNKEIREERFSDNLQKTTFPNVYAPISFLNAYEKILEQLGFIFTSDPQVFIQNNLGGNRRTEDILLEYDAARMRAMENAIAKMRQMTMHASHIVRPNDTYSTGADNYKTTAPKYNLGESHYIEKPQE